MTTWMTISEASVILGMSERTIWRRISEGKLEAKLDGNRRLVKIEVDDDKSDIIGMTMSDKDALIKWLRNELDEKNEQIQRLQMELKQNRERSDAIIMRLTEELEAQRRLLEQQHTRGKEPFWRRLSKANSQSSG